MVSRIGKGSKSLKEQRRIKECWTIRVARLIGNLQKTYKIMCGGGEGVEGRGSDKGASYSFSKHFAYLNGALLNMRSRSRSGP